MLSAVTVPVSVLTPALRQLYLKASGFKELYYFHALLAPLACLEELAFLDRRPGFVFPCLPAEPGPSISLPGLHTLALSPLFDLPDANVLRQLNCPGLRILRLGHHSADTVPHFRAADRAGRHIPHILAVVQEKMWNIEELCLGGSIEPEKEIDRLLTISRTTQCIERLDLTEELHAILQPPGQTSRFRRSMSSPLSSLNSKYAVSRPSSGRRRCSKNPHQTGRYLSGMNAARRIEATARQGGIRRQTVPAGNRMTVADHIRALERYTCTNGTLRPQQSDVKSCGGRTDG